MNYFILLCGGVGSRYRSITPKQFTKINNTYVFMYSLIEAKKANIFDQYIIAADDNFFDLIKKETEHLQIDIKFAKPGKTRELSVYNSIAAINDESNNSIVMIHDAARVLLKASLINELYVKCSEFNSAIPYKLEKNAIFDINTSSYLNKKDLYVIETPQAFNFLSYRKAINIAVENGEISAEDDGYIYNMYVDDLKFVLNDKPNFKLTTQDDISLIEKELKNESK
ncbi:MAG: 2-C-methyl-D-erythritol 4-phosphate cytidylyltransferase [Bacilli bacterium]